MLDSNDVQHIADRSVYSSDNEKIGKAGQVYLDDETGRPEWMTVNTGLFGTKESFVPLREASLTDDKISVPYTKDKVKDAPNVAPDSGHITHDEENSLYQHYDLTFVSAVAGNENRAEGHDTSGPNTDETMTRSEEQLKVGTQTREAGQARLRKYVVTEEQTVTVPVTREEVRLEREPITDANAGEAMAGAEISEEEHDVVLHEEQVVVQKEAVPVERVKLGTETVTEEKQVTEQVRTEQIETEGVEDDTAGDYDRDTRR